MTISNIDTFMASFADNFEYSYVTIYKGDTVMCEGFTKALQKILNFSLLPVRSYYVLEAEDGSVFVDLYT